MFHFLSNFQVLYLQCCSFPQAIPILESFPLLEKLHDRDYLKRVRECSEMGDRPGYEDLMKSYDGIYVNKVSPFGAWMLALIEMII